VSRIDLPSARRSDRRARRGSAYVLILMTTMIVTVIGLSAVALSRVELRRSNGVADARAARGAARAAIEFGFLKIASETTWSNLGTSNPAWATNVSFHGGSFSLTRLAYDNTDPLNDRLTLLAVGTHGEAVFRLKVVIVGGTRIESEDWTQVVN
jgi:Tfp pilus assembly protein PilX